MLGDLYVHTLLSYNLMKLMNNFDREAKFALRGQFSLPLWQV